MSKYFFILLCMNFFIKAMEISDGAALSNYRDLLRAIEGKKNDIVEEVVRTKKVVEGPLLNSVIGHAWYYNNYEAIKILLNYGFDPDKTYYLEPPLHCIVKNNNIELIQLLLNHGANVNIQDKANHFTPLHIACDEDNQELMDLLKKWGADENLVNKRGEKPFDLTASGLQKKYDKEVKEWLSKQGNTINQNPPLLPKATLRKIKARTLCKKEIFRTAK